MEEGRQEYKWLYCKDIVTILYKDIGTSNHNDGTTRILWSSVDEEVISNSFVFIKRRRAGNECGYVYQNKSVPL